MSHAKAAIVGLILGILVAMAVVKCDAATIRVPQDVTTIQGGIDATSPGDTVLVSPGSYPEHIRVARAITVRGVKSPRIHGAEGATPPHAWPSHIDGFDIQGSVTLSGDALAISHCTITGRIRVPQSSSSLMLIKCDVYCSTDRAIYLAQNSFIDVEHTDFTVTKPLDELAYIEGGITFRGGEIKGNGTFIGFNMNGGTVDFTNPANWAGPETIIRDIEVPFVNVCGRIVWSYSSRVSNWCDEP